MKTKLERILIFLLFLVISFPSVYINAEKPNIISVNDTALAAGRSPYNWYVSGSSYMQSINPGAYFKVKFDGTSISLGVDISAISGVGTDAKKYPRIAYQIDGGAWQTYQLLSTDTQVSLGSSLNDTTHDLEVIFIASDAYTTRWDGTMSLKITGLILDTGKNLSAATLCSKKMLVFGDSITEGAWVLGNHSNLTDYSNYELATSSWVNIVASNLSVEYGNVAFGGQSWGNSWDLLPSLPNSWNYYFSTNSRLSEGLFFPAPDYILENMGHNDGSVNETIVSNWLKSLRAAAGSSAKIFVILPFSGTSRANIISGFNLYKSSSSDINVFLIDLGSDGVTYSTSIPKYSYDGSHPNVAGDAQLGSIVSSAIQTYINPIQVLGCINSSATNYNSSATQDDGSCTYAPAATPTGSYENNDYVHIHNIRSPIPTQETANPVNNSQNQKETINLGNISSKENGITDAVIKNLTSPVEITIIAVIILGFLFAFKVFSFNKI